jgi:quinol monooxygenase YgiN
VIVVAGTVRVKAEKREAAVRAALAMAEATRAEPGCLAYRFSADLADPTTFSIFEEWTDADALARHFATDHMQAFRRAIPDLVAGPAAIKRYVVERAEPM